MTKKSIGRIERDIKLEKAEEALKNNTCWDDLNIIAGQALGLMQQHLMITGLMRNKELCGFLTNPGSVASNGKLLAKDVAQLSDDLARLAALHAGKEGGTDDPDVVMHCIGIYEQYSLFLQRHEAVVMPTIGAILEQFNEAEQRLNVAVAAGNEVLDELAANLSEDDKALARLSRGATEIADAEFEEVPARGLAPELVHVDESPFLAEGVK